jgi:hypothetical protein
MDREASLRSMYEAFNAREIAAVLAHMTDDVDWPNGWEGGRVIGQEAVRDYWARQWAVIDPTVSPTGFTARGGEVIAVDVDQLVRDLDGAVVDEAHLLHVYRFEGPLIAQMDIEELAGAD